MQDFSRYTYTTPEHTGPDTTRKISVVELERDDEWLKKPKTGGSYYGIASHTGGESITVITLDARDLDAMFAEARFAARDEGQQMQYEGQMPQRMRAREERDLDAGGEGGPAWYGLNKKDFRPPGVTESQNIPPLAAARMLIAEGWEAGAQKVAELRRELLDVLPPPVSIRRKLRWRDEGDELDRDRGMNGDLDQMWRVSKRDAVGAPQVISIAASWGGNCDMSGDQLFWSGAALAALSDALEDAGYSTELYCTQFMASGRRQPGTANEHFVVGQVKVKEAGDPLVVDMLAAVAAHPATYRTYGITMGGFARYGVHYGWGSHCGSGLRLMERVNAAGVLAPVDILLPTCTTQEQAIDAVRAALEQLSGAVAEEV
jgi:hypothetical protein